MLAAFGGCYRACSVTVDSPAWNIAAPLATETSFSPSTVCPTRMSFPSTTAAGCLPETITPLSSCFCSKLATSAAAVVIPDQLADGVSASRTGTFDKCIDSDNVVSFCATGFDGGAAAVFALAAPGACT